MVCIAGSKSSSLSRQRCVPVGERSGVCWCVHLAKWWALDRRQGVSIYRWIRNFSVKLKEDVALW
jgi:hypothetical protein